MKTTEEKIRLINYYLSLNENKKYIKTRGLISGPVIEVDGYIFMKYDNGNCHTRLAWIKYYLIKKGSNELRTNSYSVYINRVFHFLLKRGIIKSTI